MVDFEEQERELEEKQAEQQAKKEAEEKKTARERDENKLGLDAEKLDEVVDKITDVVMTEQRKEFIDSPRGGSPRRQREDPTTPLIREVPFGADTRAIESPEHGDPDNFDHISQSMTAFDKFEAEQDELPEDEQFPKFGDVTGQGKKMMMDTTKGHEVDANSFRVIPHGGISIPFEQERIVRPMEKRNFEHGRLKARSERDHQRDEDAIEIAKDITQGGKPSRFVNRKTKKIRPDPPVRSDFARIISAKDGFSGNIFSPTQFKVGEGNKKEFVSRKKTNQPFNVLNFDMNPMPKKLRKKQKKSNDFDFMGGF